MGKIVSPRFGRALYWASIVAAFAVGMALVLAADPFLPQPHSLPTVNGAIDNAANPAEI